MYTEKKDTQKVYPRLTNSSARGAPTKHQLVRKQTPRKKNQLTPEEANLVRKCPPRGRMSTPEATSPSVWWKNNASQTMGPRIKPHETTNKDDSGRTVAYNCQGVGGTPTIRAYLTQNRNRSWNANTLQMYTTGPGTSFLSILLYITYHIYSMCCFFFCFVFLFKQATDSNPHRGRHRQAQ